MLLFGPKLAAIEHVKRQLTEQYQIKDLGEANYCLGVQIRRNRASRVLTIDQSAYIRKILRQYDLLEARTVRTPAESNQAFVTTNKDNELANQGLYQQAVGSLIYAAVATRLDIAYSLGKLSQHSQQPARRHWVAVQRIFRYLAATVDHGIQYGPGAEDSQLIGYSDSDFASDQDNRKSVTGCLFKYAGGAVAWSSRRQRCVATSTTEAEYIALSEAGKQAKWYGLLLASLGYSPIGLITILGDNQAALALTKDPKHHSRTKYRDIRYHWIRELVGDNIVALSYCPTSKMLADGLTKPLIGEQFARSRRGMGLEPVATALQPYGPIARSGSVEQESSL